MSHITFPQELFNLFIDALASDHHYALRMSTLKACSLAFKSLSIPARSHIFSSISIYYDFADTSKLDAIHALRGALERDLQLAARVCIFEMYFWNVAESFREPAVALLLGIMAVLTTAQESLDQQGRLHTLGLGGYKNRVVNWTLFPPEFRNAWEALCASSTITTFRLRTIQRYPLALVPNRMRRLRGLEMAENALNWPSYPWSEVSQRLLRRHFASLEVVECLKGNGDPSVSFDVIVRVCASSATTLKITFSKYFIISNSEVAYINLGMLHALHTLIIEIRKDDPSCWFCMEAVLDMLKRSTPNTIFALRIDIITDRPSTLHQSFGLGSLQDLQSTTLRKLDVILSGISFNALRTLSVRVLIGALAIEVSTDDPSLLPSHVEVLDLYSNLPRTRHKLESSYV